MDATDLLVAAMFFVVAVIVRYLWLLFGLVRGKAPEEADPTKTTSAL